MKKLYQFFNHIHVNEVDEVGQPVGELEIKKAQKKLLASLPRKNKRLSGLRVIAVAACLVVGLSVGIVGTAFPTVASQVPLLGNLFTLFGDEERNVFEGYHENAQALNLSAESNGVVITLNEAVYDGDLLTVSFKVKTTEKLSDWVTAEPFFINGQQVGFSTTLVLEKIGEDEYGGILSSLLFEQGNEDSIKVDWAVKELVDHKSDTSVQGDWQFRFSLDRVHAQKMKLNDKLKNEVVEVKARHLEKTAVSLKFTYEVHVIDADVTQAVVRFDEVMDNRGNSYRSIAHTAETLEEGVKFNQTDIYSKLDEEATELYLTPQVLVFDQQGESEWVQLDSLTIRLR
ncbi:DUF4179 domain-containing protein [Sporosarcina sp. FSL K6-2383]|uniref:DUF4179 domain-containing protein n=1 Tax=Sporosarcina sp. FSL K6-2383 TaxID=2921556 RepID=UPI00315A3042